MCLQLTGACPACAALPPPARCLSLAAFCLLSGCRLFKNRGCQPDGKSLEDFSRCYREAKVGPLDAVHDFLAEEPVGVWQQDKTREYLLYSQHADGWLKRLQ